MDAQQAAFLAQQSTGVWQWESNATAAVLAVGSIPKQGIPAATKFFSR